MSNKKSKKRRNLYLLILLAILCMGAYILVHRTMSSKNKTDEDPTESAELILEADTDTAVKLSYQIGKQSVSLEKDGDTWKFAKDKMCPIDQTKVSEMLAVFASTEATKKIADTKENKSEYGLDQPSLTATLTMKDKTKVSYEVGISAIGESEGYYISVSGKQGVYLAPESISSAFQYVGTQLVTIEDIPEMDADNMYELSVETGNKTVFAAKEKGDDFVITAPYETEVVADSAAISSLFGNYTSYSLNENVDYDCKDLEKYGLKNPKHMIHLKYYESVEDDSTDKKGDKKSFTLYIGTTNQSGDHYVRIEGSNSVYTMSASRVSTLIDVEAFSQVEKLVVNIELDSVKKITFDTGKKKDSITVNAKAADDSSSDSESELVYNAKFNGVAVDDSQITALYNKLTALELKAEKKQVVETESQVLAIEIKYGNKGQNTKKLVINTYDADYDRISIDGASYFVVDKRVVDELKTELDAMK